MKQTEATSMHLDGSLAAAIDAEARRESPNFPPSTSSMGRALIREALATRAAAREAEAPKRGKGGGK